MSEARGSSGVSQAPPCVFGRSVEINEAGLVLGAGSRLARMRRDEQELALDEDGERVMALLTVAVGRPARPDVLGHVKAASDHWRRGDRALANLRLMFARLPQVEEAADAYRLSLAEYLLDHGMTPAALMKELGFSLDALAPAKRDDFAKYNPDQPRVPAGSDEESGRWARDGNIVVAIDDSEPGEKHTLGRHESSDYVDPSEQHHNYIPINPLQGTLPPGIGPGPFARYGVPAGPALTPSRPQQRAINALGREYGCHSCGTKDPKTRSGDFVGDHQPPTALVRPGMSQFYLPHCLGCSPSQGGRVRSYKRRDP